MLEFKPIQVKSAARLRKYYSKCTYRLCEYSVGVKLMWRHHWHPAYAESSGCLVVLNRSHHLGCIFDYPVPLPGKGDVDAALDEIDGAFSCLFEIFKIPLHPCGAILLHAL